MIPEKRLEKIDLEVCKKFDEAKSRFLAKNREYGGAFFELGKENAFSNIWKKWLITKEFFEDKFEMIEIEKELMDFAIYLIMCCVKFGRREERKTRDKNLYCYTFSGGAITRKDLPKSVKIVKNIPGIGLSIYQGKNEVYFCFRRELPGRKILEFNDDREIKIKEITDGNKTCELD